MVTSLFTSSSLVSCVPDTSDVAFVSSLLGDVAIGSTMVGGGGVDFSSVSATALLFEETIALLFEEAIALLFDKVAPLGSSVSVGATTPLKVLT